MSNNFTFFIPSKILFGAGSLDRLADETLPGKKALIVISAGKSAKASGALGRVTKILSDKEIQFTIYDKIQPNPIRAHVNEAASVAREFGADFVIGLGGGSAIDASKSIAAMATNPGDIWDYVSGGSGGGKSLENKALPIVAITTTAGTGTEADPWTVITHEERGEKIGIGFIPDTFPTLSIVDPQLMLTVPPKFTAYQGFDAFFHAAEGYFAVIANPISDLLALKSIELVRTWLPTAVKDGANLEARTNVALANTLSGMVESTSGCTSEHAIEHALSGFHPELPHGAGLIMLSIAYFSYFAEHAPERLAEMAPVMGVDTAKLSITEAAHAFVAALHSLQEECGVADLKLSDYGVVKADALKYAKHAFRTMGGLFSLDRSPLTEESTAKIIADSWK